MSRLPFASSLALLLGAVSTLGLCAPHAFARPEDAPKDAPKSAKVDLNRGTLEELLALPGVGEVTAMKIIAWRPYKEVSDLSRAGLSDALIEKLTPLVTIGKPEQGTAEAPASDPKAAAEAKKVSLNHGSLAQLIELPAVGEAYAQKIVDGRPWKAVDDLTKTGLSEAAVEKLKPLVTLKEVVWVNLDTKIFHRPSSHWFGKTREGVYMFATAAEKAGYREAGETEEADEPKKDEPAGMK